MPEKNLNFDQTIDRMNTNCLKYDFAKKRGMREDLMPLWVADMDFKTSSYIQEAIQQQAIHGIFGYSEGVDSYEIALKQWMKQHYDFEISSKWLIKTPGIVFALAMAVKALTKEQDAVLIQSPVYYPFREVIEENNRTLVENMLYLGEDNRYHIDFIDFEDKIIKNKVKLFFLCNPHNPVGRVWSSQELIQLGDICVRHNVLVVSDEIHADFVFVGKHHVFANLKKEFLAITITCTSPSKTFNLAGLQISNILIANENIKKHFKHQVDAAGYSQVNAMGIVACQTAYTKGEQWYQAMLSYVKENVLFTKAYMKKHLPQIRVIEQEGTYLVWMDFRSLGLTCEELEDVIINQAKLLLDSGTIFGACGAGFERINVACPKSVLMKALKRLEHAINEHKDDVVREVLQTAQ